MRLRVRRWILSQPPWRSALAGACLIASVVAGTLGPFGLTVAIVADVVAMLVAGPLLYQLARLLQALELARVEAQLLAEMDTLTGLLNHDRFATVLTRDIGVVRRAGGAYSLLLIEIDELPKVIEAHGVDAGELVILGIVNLCGGGLRSTDILARWGEGQLVIALPGSGSEGAAEVAERLRAGAATMVMSGPNRAAIRVTLSIGVATWGAGMESVDTLLGQVGGAVSAARSGGCNRVVVATSEAAA